MIMRRLGQLLSTARKVKNLSLRQLSNRVRGVSPSYLCRLERGIRTHRPSTKLLGRIAKALSLDHDLVLVAAGRLPDDVVRWLVTEPGAIARIRKSMAA
jgi:transcriptional regulator with XRE-family HTH domain